jgi:acetoacetate decarboxylase
MGEEVLATHAPARPDRFYPYEFYAVCLETDYDAQISIACKHPDSEEPLLLTMAPTVPLGMFAAEPRIIGVPIEGALGEYIVKVTGAKGPWALEARGTCVTEP